MFLPLYNTMLIVSTTTSLSGAKHTQDDADQDHAQYRGAVCQDGPVQRRLFLL